MRVPYNKPVTRTREYIKIMRKIMAREGPVEFDGKVYQLPLKGEGTTGLGKALKSTLGAATNIPIYSATITPNGIAAAAEVADGFFPVFYNPDRFDIFEEDLNRGFAKACGQRSLENFDIAPFVSCVVGDDVGRCDRSTQRAR